MSRAPRESIRPASPLRRLARVVWVWGPAALMMGAIFFLSSQGDLPALPGDLSDKTGHFWGYFVLGALVLRGTAGARLHGVTVRAAVTAWVISVAYGATDEWHQAFVPGRTMALDDWVADAFGAATAIVGLWLVAARLRRQGRTV